MAARIRRELRIDVDLVHGKYGEFKVLVDGNVVVDGGRRTTQLMRDSLGRAPTNTIALLYSPLASRTGMFGVAFLGLFVIILVARWRQHRGGK